MQILVLDTIHGGREIGAAIAGSGHAVDVVDVYRGSTPDLLDTAKNKEYDLIVAPVHLDPDYPLLADCHAPVITHHEAVRLFLGKTIPFPMVEITGARGKTTTAFALAHLLSGPGILHTSAGTYAYPEKTLLWKRSITPGSVLSAVAHANRMPGWLIAEESLGVTGAGDLAIITSPEDYVFANGKKHALTEKIASAASAKCLLVADGISCNHAHAISLGELASCDGMKCTVEYQGARYVLANPLFQLPPYRSPLMLAAAAAVLLHIDPSPLSRFAALPGRMSVSHAGDLVIVDNANSGTNEETTVCASRYARSCAKTRDLTLVIGQAAGDGAVCEGFSHDQVARTIGKVMPTQVIWVGTLPDPDSGLYRAVRDQIGAVCTTLEEGRRTALQNTKQGSIVLAVKTWR